MSDRLVTFACSECSHRDALLVLEEASGTATTQCAKCAAPILVALERSDLQPGPGRSREQLRVRLARVVASLRLLHDEVVRYLRIRDLDVHELPRDSPLRVAIENAEREVFANKE